MKHYAELLWLLDEFRVSVHYTPILITYIFFTCIPDSYSTILQDREKMSP